jgi:hypothetical protein
MAVVKMNLSLDERTATLMRQRAAEQGKPIARYVSELVEQDVRSAQDRLGAEGYQLLAEESRHFAGMSFEAGAETWPEW